MHSLFQPDATLNGSGSSPTVNSSVEDVEDVEDGSPLSVDVDGGTEIPHEASLGILRNGGYGKTTVAPAMEGAGPLTRLGGSSQQLPNLEPHQHSTLFYLSLIEGRCRSQAAFLLNKGRHPTEQLREDHPEVRALSRPLFAEMSKELHKAGILPHDFAGEDLEELRGQYLNTFDTALHTIATKATNIIPDHSTGNSSHISNAFAIARAPRVFDMEKMMHNNLLGGPQSLLSSLILKGSGGEQLPTSVFRTQYGPKTLIGKGGFGYVFRAKNLVDDREYAIKRIVIRGKKVNLADNKDQQQALLIEARSLSKLSHQNIVRYYGAWVETCPAGTRLDVDLDKLSEEISESDPPEEPDEQVSKLGQLTLDSGPVHGLGLQTLSGGPLFYSQDQSDIFERGSAAGTSAEPSQDSEQMAEATEEPSALVKSSKSHSKGQHSESEDNKIVRSVKPSPSLTSGPELDVILFIKMDFYEMTLQQFLFPKVPKEGEFIRQHCFHIPTTAQFLSAIIDGVEYIHSHGMVHRDLKPGNILLSVHSSYSPGSIDIMRCPQCPKRGTDKHCFITPHIGDFGLVAEIKKPTPGGATTPRGEHVFEPTELARLAPAGSRFYTPNPPIDVICPKLDVYSLGVVTFELLYKFDTRSERLIVLEGLKNGDIPALFKYPELVPAIKAMNCDNRYERWGCADIRKWLEELKERYGRV